MSDEDLQASKSARDVMLDAMLKAIYPDDSTFEARMRLSDEMFNMLSIAAGVAVDRRTKPV